MPVEWVTAYDKNAGGRKLPHRVPRSYLDRFENLSETPASKRRKKATPAPEADTTTAPEEEASNGDQSS